MIRITTIFSTMTNKVTLKIFLFFAAYIMNSQIGFGQVIITGLGSGNTYSQNFEGLTNTGAATTLPKGWVFLETGTGADTTYNANYGNNGNGNTCNFGTNQGLDRALGTMRGGNNDIVSTIGVVFTNNTGQTVTNLNISYAGEQWRLAAINRVDRLDFQYSTDATSLSSGTWTDVNSLDFTAPVTSGALGNRDGNLLAHRASISSIIKDLSIAAGQTLWFRWLDFDASTSNDDGLGIDDFSVYAESITTWNGSAWSNGVPTSFVEAVIDGTYNTNVGGIQGPFTAKKLTVNTGKILTVKAGTTVTIQNEVINNGNLVVENNANLIQVNNVANTGAITVNRDSSPVFRLDYTMWSSPVSGSQTLGAFSPLTTTTPGSRFYNYNTSTDTYSAVPSTNLFAPGAGYLIRIPNTWVPFPGTPTSWTGNFSGTPNNGNITYTMTIAGNSYNAVGNPYPSTINMVDFITANAITNANIDGTLYFWRKTNDALNSISYSTCTTGGCTVANGHTYAGSDFISVGQGFIVKALTTTLNFTNSLRTPTNTNQFFRTKVIEKNRIWLNLSHANVPINQMMLVYMTGATQGIDSAIDGRYINDSKTALNSLISNEEYAIQGRSLPFDGTDVVPLAFKTTTAGNFTIAIDHVDGLFASAQEVYLVDSKTGLETDLKSGAYTFATVAGVDNDRFSLKYQRTLGVADPSFDDNSITVYKNKGTLYVNSGAIAINNVKVFDIQGRLIAEQKNVKANMTTINNLKATNQVLIVKIRLEDNIIISKKVVN